ncbi:hypothetical protein BaRGS_00000889 [Batillaria attramentaria]|uniref:Uncharacterized protein n=1 Tax=Batillaria attramentaria TaxID=370345 RepID=A0ABD0M913_9CAEN
MGGPNCRVIQPTALTAHCPARVTDTPHQHTTQQTVNTTLSLPWLSLTVSVPLCCGCYSSVSPVSLSAHLSLLWPSPPPRDRCRVKAIRSAPYLTVRQFSLLLTHDPHSALRIHLHIFTFTSAYIYAYISLLIRLVD